MRISTDYITKFYKNHPDLKDKLTEEECILICSSPFKFFKQVMNEGILKNLRIKYLGTIEVNKPMIKYTKKITEDRLAKGHINEDQYNKKMKLLNSYES